MLLIYFLVGHFLQVGQNLYLQAGRSFACVYVICVYVCVCLCMCERDYVLNVRESFIYLFSLFLHTYKTLLSGLITVAGTSKL